MTALTWTVKNIPDRNTMEYFTEEIDDNFFHLLMRMLSLCLALVNFLLSIAPPSFQLCDHGGINTTLGREVGQIVTGRRPSL